MKEYKYLNQLVKHYQNNGNIMKYLRDIKNTDFNSLNDILISYDFQAGSYIAVYDEVEEFMLNYTNILANIIMKLESLEENFKSILEVGVGEATTLGSLIPQLNSFQERSFMGFDISLSRILYGNEFLTGKGINNSFLFTGDLFQIPLKDNSIDLVFTSHSIEPNGGKEKAALEEIYRIANRYIILLEPCYELASANARKRMLKNGYVTNLYQTILELGYEVVEYRLFDICMEEENPTGLIIIRKEKESVNQLNNDSDLFVCPHTRKPLKKYDSYYYSQDALLAYPIIKNIPCLLPTNAILATHLKDF